MAIKKKKKPVKKRAPKKPVKKKPLKRKAPGKKKAPKKKSGKKKSAVKKAKKSAAKRKATQKKSKRSAVKRKATKRAAKKKTAKKATAKKKAVKKKTAPKKKAESKNLVVKKTSQKKPVTPKSKLSTAPKKSTATQANWDNFFTPLDDRLLVEALGESRVTAGGIIIPGTASVGSGPQKGKVLAVGRGHRNEKGKVKPMDVKVGDVVLFSSFVGSTININNCEVSILREEEVLGVIN